MPDPRVFGPDAADDNLRRRSLPEAEALRRAYLGHGDQLGALEAEAYLRDHAVPGGRGWRIRRTLRLMFGPWTGP